MKGEFHYELQNPYETYYKAVESLPFKLKKKISFQ